MIHVFFDQTVAWCVGLGYSRRKMVEKCVIGPFRRIPAQAPYSDLAENGASDWHRNIRLFHVFELWKSGRLQIMPNYRTIGPI